MQDNVNPYAPPKAIVNDVADEVGPVERASRGTRLGAAMLDTLIVFALFLPVLISIGFNPAAWASVAAIENISGPPFFISCLLAVGWIVMTVVLVKRNSQTIGKKLLGIKVVRSDGSHASLGRIFWLRNVVNTIPSFIPIVGNVYGLVDSLMIFTEKQQCLHDKIADTIVIRA